MIQLRNRIPVVEINRSSDDVVLRQHGLNVGRDAPATDLNKNPCSSVVHFVNRLPEAYRLIEIGQGRGSNSV